MDEVLRLIYDYSKKGKLLDFYALNLIVEYYKKDLMLEDYILSFKISDYPDYAEKKDDFTKANYFIRLKEIRLYEKNIEKSIKISIAFFHWIKNCCLIQNLYILISLIHEIAHAYHQKLMYSKSSDLEVRLLRASDLIYIHENLEIESRLKELEGYLLPEVFTLKTSSFIRKQHEIIDQSLSKFRRQTDLIGGLYQINPAERMAEISAYLEIINIFNYIKNSDLIRKYNIIWDLKFSLNLSLLTGYDEIGKEFCCPAHKYLTKMELTDLWESFDFFDEDLTALIRNAMNEYSLEDRLFLGLPIGPKEEKEISAITRSKFIPILTKQSTIKEHFIL